MLSRCVIAFLSRSKCLLISWLQSPSTVILEPKKIKSVTVSIVSPSICHEVMGPDAMILVFWMLNFKLAFSCNTLYVKSFLLMFFYSTFLSRLQLRLSLSTVSSLQPLSPRHPTGIEWELNSSKANYLFPTSIQFNSVQSLSRVQLFATPWISALQASPSITNSQSSLKFIPIELVMPSSHLILCRPLLLLPLILPASGSFPMSQLFAWGGQSTGVSALSSFLPKNTQDWSPLEWTGWVSLQSKGLARVFSNTTVQKHQFFGSKLSSQSNSHIHTWLLEKP